MVKNRSLQPIKPVPWLRSRFIVGVGSLLGLLACDPGAPEAEDATPNTTGANTSALGNQPPVILVAATTPTRLTEGQPLTIAVVATDPDGISDLIGGVVRAQTGNLVLGTLATDGDEGAYSLTLPWATLQQAGNVIDAPAISGRDIDFEIEMFDASGASTSATVHAHFSCSKSDYGLCSGVCTDLMSDIANCGVCGFDCAKNGSGNMDVATCESGRYCAKTKRTWLDPIGTPAKTCNQQCAEIAGSSAASSFSESETLVPASSGCGVNGDTSFNDLPSTCYTAESLIECKCGALYRTPAY